MHYVVYIDVLFVVNFIMDYVVLSITSTILPNVTTWTELPKSRAILVKYIRKVAGSLIGATWAMFILLLKKEQVIFTIMTYAIIGPVMLMVTTGKIKFKEFLKSIGVMYLVTFVLAGAMHAIYYYTLVGYFIHSMPKIWMLSIGGIISNVLIRWIVAMLIERKGKKQFYCTVIIENNNKEVKLPGFFDTGNSLKDPIYKEVVHIVLKDCVTTLLDGQNSYHLIPYTSIGNENGLIPVVRMEKIKIINEKEIVTVEKPLFALYDGRFSKNTPYRVILNPNVVNNSRCV